MKIKILTAGIAIIMVLSFTVPAVAAETNCDIDMSISRAEFVMTLYQALEEPETGEDNPFSDVPESEPFAQAIKWAAQSGVVAGVGDGRFAPLLAFTREQAAALLLNYAQSVGAGPVGAWAIYLDYADVSDISDWAFQGVMYAKILGIFDVMPGNLFDPQGNVTQQEASEWIAVLLERIETLLASRPVQPPRTDGDQATTG